MVTFIKTEDYVMIGDAALQIVQQEPMPATARMQRRKLWKKWRAICAAAMM